MMSVGISVRAQKRMNTICPARSYRKYVDIPISPHVRDAIIIPRYIGGIRVGASGV